MLQCFIVSKYNNNNISNNNITNNMNIMSNNNVNPDALLLPNPLYSSLRSGLPRRPRTQSSTGAKAVGANTGGHNFDIGPEPATALLYTDPLLYYEPNLLDDPDLLVATAKRVLQLPNYLVGPLWCHFVIIIVIVAF